MSKATKPTPTKMSERKLPKGWTCTCGTLHQFSPWVYAHWDIEIQATCADCNRQVTFLGGEEI